MWYWRAARLARRAHKLGVKGSELDFANAHLGLGNLELDRGFYEQAERHYGKAIQAALRVGRKSLAGAGYHNLLALKIATKNFGEAQKYAREAASHYPADHPRIPILAHDTAFLWFWQGYFSSALLILEKVLPWVDRQRERIIVLASLARCAAAVKDHIRYERAAADVLAMAAENDELADSSLYHIAEGARSFWEWDKAEKYTSRALKLAQERDNAAIAALAESLLDAIRAHKLGDVDTIPAADSETDTITTLILRKLQKQPAPAENSRAVPPEYYPNE
jgi:tetratricopeptide (TPR) repeat protein